MTAAEKQAAYRTRKAEKTLRAAERSAAHLAKPKSRRESGRSIKRVGGPPAEPIPVNLPSGAGAPQPNPVIPELGGKVRPRPGSLLKTAPRAEGKKA
jgi:hypothetical protein